ncbi:hypothetical protein BD309DRAFT_761313 [Dichomitus squalens]|uniref:Uncharacterized protein n=1 Tax=Dichomitus squalens TaxID=114155 RepID=A0A4Q9NVA9_9APHY|nr:hypothetical protein BD309DRAFT_761313 [Dichomitus squalens]TBU54797.1 hypothetical protein BD310DRAFT_935106 [Dichomitus squalens]
MPSRLLRRAAQLSAVATIPPAYFAYRTITRLEAKYPPCPPESSSTPALRTPANPATQHVPYIDVYATRVPARGLIDRSPENKSASLEEAWAHTFLENKLLRATGPIMGTKKSSEQTDYGEHGFHEGQKLANDLFLILRPPAPGSPLLVDWRLSDGPVSFFRRIAAWGYPWRLMSGGRHEFGVGPVDADGTVEVRFGSAHDYDWVEEEGDAQKTIPEWVKRCHRAYARWLLDERVEEVERRARVVDEGKA